MLLEFKNVMNIEIARFTNDFWVCLGFALDLLDIDLLDIDFLDAD